MGICEHYTGLVMHTKNGKKSCKSGIEYYDQFGGKQGIIKRMSCTKGNQWGNAACLKACPFFQPTTRKESEKQYSIWEVKIKKIMVLNAAVAEWRVEPKHSRPDIIECPTCKGNLHLVQASINGDVHGKCETKNCVSFME
jgi:hypothetical protein